MKVCCRCKKQLPIDNFGKNKRQSCGLSYYCTKCRVEYNKIQRHANPKIRQKKCLLNYEWKKRNKDQVNVSRKRGNARLKKKLFDAFGSICVCCGETSIEFLTIDHINGGGRAHREKSGGSHQTYRDIIKQGCPRDLYRILCMNCNFATRFREPCPHQKMSLKNAQPQNINLS